MDQIIIHVDMDAFYASVEMRDDPSLCGKPLIIGSLPHERGVVSTCSYEARKYGVHSAMNIKEAYRLCPNGIFMHPNFHKYKAVSEQLHVIWSTYATALESIALDEAFLDVTETAGTFERATEIAKLIKQRTLDEIGLSCSVGVSYCKTAAKTASEEKKPAGYFEIPDAKAFVDLIIDRDVRSLFTVGQKTAEKLYAIGIHTVRQLREREEDVVRLLGKQGMVLIQLAYGVDERRVTPYDPQEAKSISREITFQKDVNDYEFLKDVLLLIAMSVEERARQYGLHGNGVVLKITFSDMKSITRSKTTLACDDALTIHREAVKLLETVNKRPVRLIGTGIHNLSKVRQLTLDDVAEADDDRKSTLRTALDGLSSRYGLDMMENIDQTYQVDSLHTLAEHMRTHRPAIY